MQPPATANLPAVIAALGDTPHPGRWTEFDRSRQVAFLEALASRGSVRGAARAADVSAQTVYRARQADPAFRSAWNAAQLAARARAEDVLASRAIDGIEEHVFYHGEIVGTRRRYSDRLLLAHLGRLDKLAGDARTTAFADDFEAALARFAAGEPQPGDAPPPDSAGPEKVSPGQCHMCSKSNSAPVARREVSHAELEAHRPAWAPQREEFENLGYRWDEVLDEQADAFADGIEDWWITVPPPPGWHPAADAGHGYCSL